MLKQFSKKISKIFTPVITKAIAIKSEISSGLLEGYKEVKKDKCCWCKEEKTLKELIGDRHHIFDGYLICDYCFEGIGAMEAMCPKEVSREIEGKMIQEMLRETKEDPDRERYNGYNNFIEEANRILSTPKFKKMIKINKE